MYKSILAIILGFSLVSAFGNDFNQALTELVDSLHKASMPNNKELNNNYHKATTFKRHFDFALTSTSFLISKKENEATLNPDESNWKDYLKSTLRRIDSYSARDRYVSTSFLFRYKRALLETVLIIETDWGESYVSIDIDELGQIQSWLRQYQQRVKQIGANEKGSY